jgi:pyruvate formate lyase activating enzyme
MLLGGYQKLTLIDYPGKLATTVFTVGCSFRCSFCHNPELVLASSQQPATDGLEKEFFQFLKKRQGQLAGVCVTGGEPTIQPGIVDFIKKIKKLGYAVKLDTNGSRPDVLKKIIDQGLVDFVAMDIKNCPKRYSETAGTEVDIERIKLSVELIRRSGLDYEFRTTVVPGLHAEKDFREIAEWLDGSKKYYLQKYREVTILDPNLKKKTKGRKIDLAKIKKSIEKHFGLVGIRE